MTSRPHPSTFRIAPGPHAVLTSLAGAVAGPAFIAAGWSVETTLSPAHLQHVCPPVMRFPARLVIEFGRPADAGLFEGHYQARYLSLVLAMPHYASIESALVAGGSGGTKSSYHWVTTLGYSSAGDMIGSLLSRAGQATLTDITTFATGGATARIVTGVPAPRQEHRRPT